MFTGLVQAKGKVVEAAYGRFKIGCPWEPAALSHGASISCDGCCLTVTGIEPWGSGVCFAVDVSNETLSKTTLKHWQPDREINLERSLRAGDEMGGHIVLGHVDGIAHIERVTPSGFSKVFELRSPHALSRFIAPKGSVALDGISLTVNEVEGSKFTVNLIPTTLAVTTWGDREAGDSVNMEVDLIARYVARLLGH